MNASAREKVFKSWSGISEVTIIKEVATKGENIQLCIEYWSKKRKLPVEEYEVFFHEVIETYVKRLLTERLVCKAEDVLRNVKSDVKCFFYQFVCECEDDELREQIIDHLRRKDAHNYERDSHTMQFYWDILQQLQQQPTLFAKYQTKLRRINIETLINSDKTMRGRLLVELYFANENPAILKHLDKHTVWHFLVESQDMRKIIRWCAVIAATDIDPIIFSALELKFSQWPIETEMYELALKELHEPSDVLRNCFARAGHFFANERDNVHVVLQRICTTESFEINSDLLKRLPIGKYLLERGYFYPMLEDFVSIRELTELASESVKERELLELIISLKEYNIEDPDGIIEISNQTKNYLESQGVDLQNEQPLVALFEFLCDEPTIPELNCLINSSALRHSAYFQSVSKRLDATNNTDQTIPTAYDLLHKLKKIDIKDLSKDIEGIASFSNERLIQKYGRKYHVNFLHYLNQDRSAYAVYHLLTDQLQNYGQITQTQLFSASETVTSLALQHINNNDRITHCCAFLEMLGFDSQNLRNVLKLCRMIKAENIPNYSSLITQVDAHLAQKLVRNPNNFPLTDYQALLRIVACNQYKQWPTLVLEHYAKANEWWNLLAILQYFDIPLTVVKQVCKHFSNKTMGDHFFRALAYEVFPCERKNSKRHTGVSRQLSIQSRNKPDHTLSSAETVNSSHSSTCIDAANGNLKACNSQFHYHQRFLPDTTTGEIDLIAIILMSTSSLAEKRIKSVTTFLEVLQDNQTHSTSINLLKNCVKFRMPIFALLAATVNAENVDWAWLVWLTVSINQWQELLHLALKNTRELSWLMIEKAVKLGCANTLFSSFFIFYEANPLVHLFKFLSQTQIHLDFSDEIVHELRMFLVDALAWNNDEIQTSNETVCPLANLKSQQFIHRSINLLVTHVQYNFDSALYQQKFLACICKADISDISGPIDFCQLNEIFSIMQSANDYYKQFSIDFEKLLQPNNKEYTQLLSSLLEAKKFDEAVKLASLLNLSICDIIYSKWVDSIDADGNLQCFDDYNYEAEIEEHALPPEILVNFFLYAASCLKTECSRKYQLLKRALNVIKKHRLFPNESFDRDQIEYEMISCYLQISDSSIPLEQLEIYYSEYFEEIMLKERRVLYKSFLELKELAGIEDLNPGQKIPLTKEMQERLETLLNRLLDEGDIVEALRLQELFEVRPVDLRFVVFCMALAEGVTTVLNLTLEERKLLCEVEKSSFAKFNKRTLGHLRNSGGSGGGSGGGSITGNANSPPSLKVLQELSDSCSTLEFEEIPPKEKREVLDTIQGIASRLKYGVDIGKRIVMAYRAAMYLDKEYLDVLRTKDVSVLLKSVAEDGCLHRLMVISDILTSTHMTAQEIADLLSYELATAIVRPRFYIFNSDQQSKNTMKNADLWGYNIDRELHLFLELVPNTTKLGNCLLDYCDALKIYRKFQDNQIYEPNSAFEKLVDIITLYGFPMGTSGSAINSNAQLTGQLQVLSHKKQNYIYVELLIKAHQCFVHECSMEGIANVLNRAKHLNTVLTKAKSWTLIVRMLIGIARYREMYFCFDALMENEQFESLLGQFDEEKTVGFRQAILSYLREDCTAKNNKEYLKLTAMHFSMYNDLADMWEHDAKQLIAQILSNFRIYNSQLQEQISMHTLTTSNPVKVFIPKLRCTKELLVQLQQALENYTHATENYLLDNKLLLAQKTAALAEMVAMQINLANKALERGGAVEQCVCIINVRSRDEFRELINGALSVPQSLILSRAYGYDINWAEALLMQFVIQEKSQYLQQYLYHFGEVNDTTIENIVKGFQLYTQHNSPTQQMETHLQQLVESVESITLKYKLASLFSLKSIVVELLNSHTCYYLKDTNYGRNNNNLENI